MKAEINENGVMIIFPETPTEFYALKQWRVNSWVEQEDLSRYESGHWRGSAIVVNYIIKGD